MKRTLLPIAFALALPLFAHGCATTEADSGAGGEPDAEVGQEPCGPDTCEGCCTAAGECVVDLSDSECGAGGERCEDCEASDRACDLQAGQCTDPPDCGPETCPEGCCDGDECIEPGDSDEACGSRGLQCAECDADAGEACDGSQCRTPCGPETCAGCCEDEFTCVDEPDETACGSEGEPCEECGDGGFCDAGGACIEDSCENTCDGCCTDDGECVERSVLGDEQCGVNGAPCEDCTAGSGDEVCADPGVCVSAECSATCGGGCCDGEGNCLSGDEREACGSGGDACVACGPNAICEDGECRLDPSSRWDVLIVNAEVPPLDEDGSSWGRFGGQPDPYVRMTVDLDGADEEEGETDSVSNTTFAEYNEIVLEGVRADKLTGEGQVLFEWINDNAVFDQTMSLPQPIRVPEDLFTGDLLIWAQEDHYEDAENSPLEFAVRFALFPSDGELAYDPAAHETAAGPLCREGADSSIANALAAP